MYKFGCIPDKYDYRDAIYEPDKEDTTAMTKAKKPLPQFVDLEPGCSGIEDQLQTNACQACGVVGALEYNHPGELSIAFIYYNARAYIKMTEIDSGASLRDAIKAAKNKGACPENEWPLMVNTVTVKPDKQVYKDSKKNLKVKSFSRVKSLKDIKTSLSKGVPVVFSFRVFSGFISTKAVNTGVVDMPVTPERFLGLHVACAIGYDDIAGRVKCRNSWGKGWGDRGYFTMPQEYIDTPRLMGDMWRIIRSK